MHEAARSGDIERIRKHVKEGIPIGVRDVHGDTPLHCAVEAGKIETVCCLLDLRADSEVLNLAGHTPLMKAKLLEIKLVFNQTRCPGTSICKIRGIRERKAACKGLFRRW